MLEPYATYSPEDNKLRLYVGRLPREEYLKLKAEGWTTLHKQREAGGGDFVATWSVSRRDTALEYGCGVILDEDMGPEERAADRAERFSGYRDKREGEAVGHADSYESGPQAHGYQSAARAERSASRHDRIGTRAVDAWSKAEYWQRRTEGVIRHALYKSSPSVRMGRIKTIEAEQRKAEAELAERRARWNAFKKCEGMPEPDQTKFAIYIAGRFRIWVDFKHPVTGLQRSLYTHLTDEQNPITGAQACAMFLAEYREPAQTTDWIEHCKLRLAYENQMLSAQGGRAAELEIEKGGRWGGHLIVKVNKSPATGRVTSVLVKGEKINGWTYKATDCPGCDYSLHQFETERASKSAYTPPDETSLAELAQFVNDQKEKAPKKVEPPLINPTDEDAERLQAIWNARAKERADKEYGRFEPKEVCRIPQAVYSQNSKGAYAKAETKEICANGKEFYEYSGLYGEKRAKALAEQGPVICKLRVTGYYPRRVVVITDKPQKPLPAAVWEPLKAEAEKIAA